MKYLFPILIGDGSLEQFFDFPWWIWVGIAAVAVFIFGGAAALLALKTNREHDEILKRGVEESLNSLIIKPLSYMLADNAGHMIMLTSGIILNDSKEPSYAVWAVSYLATSVSTVTFITTRKLNKQEERIKRAMLEFFKSINWKVNDLPTGNQPDQTKVGIPEVFVPEADPVEAGV